MDLDYMLSLLQAKDTSEAFEALKEMEKLSEESDILYPYIDQFIQMIDSEKYVVRVRGFRLFCKQSRWDVDKKIDGAINHALNILNDEKPTAVRQALAALIDLVTYKKDLAQTVKIQVLAINYLQYKDTMHSLIAKDMETVLQAIEKE